MALPADLVLNPNGFGGANAATTYSFVTESNQKAIRRVTATALTSPQTLTIQHQERKSGAVLSDSHQIRVDLNKVDTNLGTVTASAWLVVSLPRGQTAITAADIKDLVGHVVHAWVTTGNADKILAGES